ncbi:similar to Saccharomyces cerevisiae YLR419W Putative helicase with limited sequence similarity to human Rb protein [Maudiozyma barnettii]|uniref:Similar to Saccharomyces cerevisiae YLR419W Putative helicase with limited sequence similarity to human Rb protein n=1 Tax=Maudiozyma barnettii TaxID=61262 RepID=A0A8H2ZJ52_9SACH|nr:putative helicase [Kazachstania barnettii]CAB4256187.1 similar to Saccharomyces cerevisiae YLR419W Putative helicase with limited sequence similarity to human Rb protein [Kazachstania barnettii]CAD1784795.1 similar to Saccharomyces cerevisiae YLR419W Putative helicase with limited sequence similarity to human Rb protein [Kazachstania barnettii]
MAKKNKKSSTPVAAETMSNGKKGKKGKKDVIEPEPDSKEAKKAKQQAHRAKVTSTASWTGKLPHTLLHEFCQKRKWNKVDYDMKKIGDKGMLAIAVLAYTDPKTKEVLTVRMNDPTYDKTNNKGVMIPQETPAEARHIAATVALCRIAYNTNMQMMLPPNHKTVWYALDDYRKELIKSNPKRGERLFDTDPFTTILEDRKLEKQREKERNAKQNQAEKTEVETVVISSTNLVSSKKKNSRVEKKIHPKIQERPLVSFPKKVWENATFIDLEESSRQLIEKFTKYNIDWSLRKRPSESSQITDAERSSLKDRLLSLKFREPHVLEAMNYSDPLSFLLFNLPEDDLPPFFHKRTEDSRNKIEISLLPLVTRIMVEKLTEIGVSNEEALYALQENNMNEAKAAGLLTQNIDPNVVINQSFNITEEESEELWSEEIGSLKSIYEDRCEIINPSCFLIGLEEKLKLKIKIYRSEGYPYTLPGIIVSTFDKKIKLPNYIKKNILTQLLNYIKQSGMLGDMLIYNIMEWLDENVEHIINNPGALLTAEDIAKSSQTNLRDLVSSKNGKSQNNRARRSNGLSSEHIQKLKDEFLNRITTAGYKSMQTVRASLPAWNKQKQIVELIENHDVVLITGETGSGKSTQVVQFLLDNIINNEKTTTLLCTQPRRISAIGLAERVSDERCTDCGDEVGYIIRGVNKTSRNTRIKFMTTGVLVRILQGEKTFLNNSIVVIDEVHERSIDTDLIVSLLKNLVGKVKNMKIVLMSATVNVDLFKKFFPGLGTIHIEGRTFPIKDYFLDDILEQLDFKIKKNERNRFYDDAGIDDNNEDNFLHPGADSRFFKSGQINYDLVCQVASYVDQQLSKEHNDGSIIIFLPGVSEINKTCRMISDNDDSNRFVVLPLHSALTPEDQKRVFKRYGRKRKIVVSTNIAETSITIDDCVATIDSGKAKTMYYNARDNTSRLLESFISKAEVKQRRGRAGRVREGVSYKLFSKATYEEMVSMPAPEIKRIALESLYLSVKAMGIKNVTSFLANGLEAPPGLALEKAENLLMTIGLLDGESKSLTELGKFISLIPVMDIKYGKLLIYSIIFGLTDTGVLAASILSEGVLPFVGGIENRDAVRDILSSYKSKGDLLATIHVFEEYLALSDSKSRSKYMKENLLSYNKVNSILSTRTQYYSNLKDIGFIPMGYKPDTRNQFNRNNGNFKIFASILTGAFYPNIARIQLPSPKFFETSAGAIEKDPEAKQIKYWIRNEQYVDELQKLENEKHKGKLDSESLPLPATRAFLHPSSVLFSSKGPDSEDMKALTIVDGPSDKHSTQDPLLKYPFVVFNSSQVTSKLFLRDITPTTTLSLLLFGGPISYDVSGDQHSPGIVVDSWLPIRTWCKNGVLIKELRMLVDLSIKQQLDNPSYANIDNKDSDGYTILNMVEKVIENE